MSTKSTLGIAAIVALLFVAVAAWAVTSHSPPGVIGHEVKIVKNICLAIDFQSAIVQPGTATDLIGGGPGWALPEGAIGLRSHAIIGQRLDNTYLISANGTWFGDGLYTRTPATAPANVQEVHPLRC